MKNPREFFWKNGKRTLAVMNELTRPTCEDGSEPLSLHHDTFSRFHFVLFSENRKAVTANIPVSLMPGIFAAVETQKVVRQLAGVLPAQPQAGAIDTKTPAFTTIIRSGKLKGATPASALIEDAEKNKPLLLNQIDWLKKNLGQYPKNQEQISAIEEALHLFDAGKLSDTGLKPVSPKTVIYPGGFRPLVRRKKSNGKAFVYSISISIYEQGESPIEISISNFYAPVLTTDKGLLNVQPKDREDEITVSCNLSMFEWEWFRHQAEAQMRTFEDMWAPSLYQTAYDAEADNRQRYLSMIGGA